MKRRFVAPLLVLLLAFAPAPAVFAESGTADGSISKQELKRLKDFMDAMQPVLQPLAIKLGVKAYEAGDYHTALQVFYYDANLGGVVSPFYMGEMRRQGFGVPKRLSRAADWYQMAASKGHAQAQYQLGVFYRDGQGVTRDELQAAVWLQSAAILGETRAQHALGQLYQRGWGVPKAEVHAHVWWSQAAEQGFKEAGKLRDALQTLMLPADVAEAKRIGARLRKDSGTGEERGYANGLRYLRERAEAGEAVAQYNLGRLYLEGQGLAQDYQAALKWLRRAAGQNFHMAQNELGHMYRAGKGVAKDTARGLKWHRRAAEQGLTSALIAIGYFFIAGDNAATIEAEAFKWLLSAAERGSTVAREFLVFVFQGQGNVARDKVEELKWIYVSLVHKEVFDDITRGDARLAINLAEEEATPAQITEAKRLAAAWLAQHGK